MAESATLARPYAQAVFSLAKDQGKLDEWSSSLDFLNTVVMDEQFMSVTSASDIKMTDVENVLIAVCQEQVSPEVCNFVRLLVRNGRLSVLRDVATQFEALKAEDEDLVGVVIESAFDLDTTQVEKIVVTMSTKLNKKVSPTVKVNPSLVGGIKVYVGDKVWDSSVKGRLQQMAAALTN